MSTPLEKSQQQLFESLLMQAVDGELTSEEQRQFDDFLKTYPECQKEWLEYKKLKEVTNTMKFKSPPAEFWDNYWLSVYNRLERGIAWLLFTLGSIILLTYGGFKAVEALISDPQLAGIVKFGIMLTIGGLVMLLFSVLREKLILRKEDPYKEVQR